MVLKMLKFHLRNLSGGALLSSVVAADEQHQHVSEGADHTSAVVPVQGLPYFGRVQLARRRAEQRPAPTHAHQRQRCCPALGHGRFDVGPQGSERMFGLEKG